MRRRDPTPLRLRGMGLFDRRLLLRNLRIETADIGLGGSYIGLRLIDRRLVVARVIRTNTSPALTR